MPEAVEIRVSAFNSAKFSGTLIGEASTNQDERWVELRVWRKEDGSGYVLHRVGQSLVYHREPTRCRTVRGKLPGELGTVQDLPDRARACDKCSPPGVLQLTDSQPIRIEKPRHTINELATPTAVIEKLTVYREHGQKVVRVSEPVQDLLEQCEENDVEFALAARAMEEIS